MNIDQLFGFLIERYGLTYRYQEFKNSYGSLWLVKTYSFFNDSGCFTIYSLPQRGELDFYYAPQFSTVREELCEKMVDICSIEKEIWDKHTKIGIINKPFFWWNCDKILRTLAEVLKAHIAVHGEFFGIKVNDSLSQ